MNLPNNHDLLTSFTAFLVESGLSSVSIKNYLSDIRHFIRHLEANKINDLQEVFQNITKYIKSYVLEQKTLLTPTATTNRRLASVRRLATYLNVKYGIVNNESKSKTDHNVSPSTSASPNLNNVSANDNSNISSKKILDQFRQYLISEKKSHSTVKNYLSDLYHYFAWIANQTPYNTNHLEQVLSNEELQNYITYQKLVHTSTSVINRRQSSIKQLTSFCFDQGFIPKNPFAIIVTEAKISRLAWFKRFSSKANKPQNASKNPLAIAYHKYNSLSFTPYFHLALLVIATTAMGILFYNQIIKSANPSLAATSLTAPKRQLSFQGRLLDSSGTPITVPMSVNFKLWDDLTAGTQLYTTGTCSVTPDQDGIFNSLIGDGVCGVEIPQSVFTDNRDVFLAVTVGAETLTPRQQIATVGYALNSETLQGYPASASATINTVPVVDNLGNITIAAASPSLVSTSGNFNIKGQALSLTTELNSGGDIIIQPDALASGQILAISGTTTEDSFRVSNANLTTGTLISGYIGNDTATGSGNLITLSSGATESAKFWVTADGRTNIATATDSAITSAFIINQNGTGNIFSASSSGVSKFNIDNMGRLSIIDGVSHTIDDVTGNLTLTSNSNTITLNDNVNFAGTTTLNGNTYTWPATIPSNNYVLQAQTDGTLAWVAQTGGTPINQGWTWLAGVLYPTNTFDAINVGNSATASATVHLAGVAGDNSFVNGGSFGIGDITPDHLLDVAGNIGLDASSYINFGDTDGTSGYGFRDNGGNIEFKNNAGVWTGIGSGTGSDWSTANGTIYPNNSTLDFLVGGQATASAKFAILNMNSGTPTASISGTVANQTMFFDGNGNISTTNRQSLVLGNSATYDSTGNILLNPNGTGNVAIGQTDAITKLTIADVTGGNGILITGTSGNQTARLQSVSGAANRAELILNDGAGGPLTLVKLTSQGSTASYINNGGNFGVGTSAPDTTLELNAATGGSLRLTYNDSNGSATTYSGMTVNSSGNLTIDNTGTQTIISDDLAVNGATSADITSTTTTATIFDTTVTSLSLGSAATTLNIGAGGALARAINVGTGTGADTINIGTGATGADAITIGNNASSTTLNLTSGTGGIITSSTSNTAASLSLTNNTATTIGAGINTLGVADIQSTSLTTGNLMNIEANALTSGKLLNLSSTSTALTTGNLTSIDWSPASTTTATGDLFRINIGTNGNTGNLFNLTDNGSSLFSVSETAVTANLPTSFTSAGDVSMAYDLNFTNPTLSNITSAAPLTVVAGETFNSSNLTLKTYNSGDVVLDASGGVTLNQAQAWDLANSSTSSLNIESGLMNFDTTNSRIGIGNIAPGVKLDIGDNTASATQTTARIVGGSAANQAPILSLWRYSQANWYLAAGGPSASDFVISLNPAGNNDADLSSSAKFTILNGGNVGIGTSAPGSILELDRSSATTYTSGNPDENTNIILANTSATANNTTGISFNAGAGAGNQVASIETLNLRGAGNGADIIFSTRNNTSGILSEKIRIMNDGNVGIGDTSPLSPLTVGSGDKFQVDANGNIVKLNNVTTSFPATQGSADSILVNNGSGTLTWFNPVGSTGTSGFWTRTATSIYPTNVNDPVAIGFSTAPDINAMLEVDGDVYPHADYATGYNLGSSSLTWAGLFVTQIAGSTGTLRVDVENKDLEDGQWNVLTSLRVGDSTKSMPTNMEFYVSGDASVSGTFGVTGTSYLTGTVTAQGDVNVFGTLDIGSGTGKLNVGVVDPPYTINGEKYATYMSGMVGVKEETTGILATNEYVEGLGYKKTINFNNQIKGSDLWLFGKTTNLKENISRMSVLLTPSSQTKTWYNVDEINNSLTIFTSAPTNISYRLTAPRFDDASWTNTRASGNDGYILNNPDIADNNIAIDENINYSIQLASIDGSYKIFSNNQEIKETSSYASSLIANLKAGIATVSEIVAINITTDKLITPLANITELNAINATISGTLFADNIKGKAIDKLNEQLGLLDEKYSTASAILAALQNQYSEFSLNNPLELSPLATTSAELPSDLSLNSLNAVSIITQDLLANGSIFTPALSSFDTDLFIQPNGDKPVHILANLMTLYPDGKVVISGDLIVTGNIYANNIDTRTATVSGTLAVGNGELATDSANILALFNNNGDVVGSVDASGSANFEQLTTGGLIIAAGNENVSTISGQTNSNSTIGIASIATGSSEIVINNSNVTDNTLVYITPISNTDNQVLYVKSKQSGSGFTVAVPQPVSKETSFNFWLVQTK